MSIPPYKRQHLAQLVLGYLLEENLMTVYDEFLMASPYLDALQNEYDRLWMKPLQQIMSEYWAVMVYIERCKPYTLRRKLQQCPTILEAVKYLVARVDLRKVHGAENINNCEASMANPQINSTQSLRECHRCSLSLESCSCRNRSTTRSSAENHSSAEAHSSAASSLSQATPSTQLPGTHNTRRKQVRVLDRDSSEAARLCVDCDESDEPTIHRHSSSHSDNSRTMDVVQEEASQAGSATKPNAPGDFDRLLNDVRSIPDTTPIGSASEASINTSVYSETVHSRNQSTDMYQGVTNTIASSTPLSIPIADSESRVSRIEPVNKLPSSYPTIEIQPLTQEAIRNTAPTKYLIQIKNAKNLKLPINEAKSDCCLNKDENRVTIISDVKVDSKNCTCTKKNCACPKKMPPVLQRAPPPPALQTQSITINGTQAYRSEPPAVKLAFTEEEIMTMPVLVVAPAPPGALRRIAPRPAPRAASPRPPPLTIDITQDSPRPTSPAHTHDGNNSPVGTHSGRNQTTTAVDSSDQSLPKQTAAGSRNQSLPKQMTVIPHSSTPSGNAPVRKASSTPRRTSSHVRVLDFATPRRILQEDTTGEVLLSRSPALVIEENAGTAAEPVKENVETPVTPAPPKKSNWDADLRALAVTPREKEKPTAKSKTHRRRAPEKDPKVPKKPKAKKKKDVEDCAGESLSVEVPVKPTIKVVKDWNEPSPGTAKTDRPPADPTLNERPTSDPTGTEKPQPDPMGKEKQLPDTISVPKLKTDTTATAKQQLHPTGTENLVLELDTGDTPEAERRALHNAIDLKLNISDILETPFKQLVYDMQMDTPRFLRPDIPGDEPTSQIKITDIPTPKFFDTPQYASRPTDYSSGSSYYKPDDHDYIPHPDDFCSPPQATQTQETQPQETQPQETQPQETQPPVEQKPSRPVRQCAKNISYCDNRPTKIPDEEPTNETTAVALDGSADEFKDASKVTPKNVRRKSTSKRRKSPAKKGTPKTFMKIKPRRPTPIKETKRKSNVPSNRKQTSSKEKAVYLPVLPAPMKSRRKSSTPRKLQPKMFKSDSSENNSIESRDRSKDSENAVTPLHSTLESDNLRLQWSEDCSVEDNLKRTECSPGNMEEDISNIKAFIESTAKTQSGSLQIDLIKRGFDIDTARSIERDLLDNTPVSDVHTQTSSVVAFTQKEEIEIVTDKHTEKANTDDTNKQAKAEEHAEIDKVVLTEHEFDSESDNYFSYEYKDTEETNKREPHKLKEFVLDLDFGPEGINRIQYTPFTSLLDKSPQIIASVKETEEAVSSILDFNRLYTPMKDRRSQCLEIFDSTLTSIDTPLKSDTPKRDVTVTEFVETTIKSYSPKRAAVTESDKPATKSISLKKTEITVTDILDSIKESSKRPDVTEIHIEVEQIVEKEDSKKEKLNKKRKRMQSGSCSDESGSGKRNRREAPTNIPNIQNIDIESVLSKLHGP